MLALHFGTITFSHRPLANFLRIGWNGFCLAAERRPVLASPFLAPRSVAWWIRHLFSFTGCPCTQGVVIRSSSDFELNP